MNSQGYQQSFEAEEKQKDSGINRFLFKVLAKWPWVLCAIIITFVISFLYTKYSTPVYLVKSSILIKENSPATSAGKEMANLSDYLNPTSDADNEAQILTTRYLMEKTVERLKANVSYFFEGSFKRYELYPSPFKVFF